MAKKKWSYLLEGGPPLLHRLPPLSECSRTHLYQCTSWWWCERLCPVATSFFFEGSCSILALFMMGDLWAHLPTLHWVFSSFWPKTTWPQCPNPYSPHLATSKFFLFPWCKNISSRGNVLPMWMKQNKKVTEALKGIKTCSTQLKNCSEQWKKHLDRSKVSVSGVPTRSSYISFLWLLKQMSTELTF